VKTDLLKNGAISRLSIAFATKSDTGNYTCSMRSAQASVMVHVPNGKSEPEPDSSNKTLFRPYKVRPKLARF
jgi:hypothetical protein